jgi:hypothetical protein
MNVEISKGKPTDEVIWNDLCFSNNNLTQHTINDEIQKEYKQEPYYVEVFHNAELIGGVRFYYWHSSKLGFITEVMSKSIYITSEFIYSENIYKNTIRKLLSTQIEKFIVDNNISIASTNNFLGGLENKIYLKFPVKSLFDYNVAVVYIDKDDESILKSFNRNTKRNVTKALENNTNVDTNISIQNFLELEKKVYDQQPEVKAINYKYIENTYYSLSKYNFVSISLAKINEEVFAGGFFTVFNKCAYSNFGGAKKNILGAGQFLYYELMKKYRDQGVTSFVFGQVAKTEDESNIKFSVGISSFKRGFGCVELPSSKVTYTINKTNVFLWEIMLKIMNLF